MSEQPSAKIEQVGKHIPRAYQDEIFARARFANIIAALETGSGKTLISTLIIKAVCSRTTSIGKKVIFLVPRVPLVEQQKTFISDQTPLRVRGYYGAMNVDAWDVSQWHSEFDLADILVMTGIDPIHWKMFTYEECAILNSSDICKYFNSRILEIRTSK